MNNEQTWLQPGAAQFGITLTGPQLSQFACYQQLLLTWNQQLNLTAIREPEGIQIRHFLDALSCSLVTGDLNGSHLIDVGTGAGFPGLPLKILFPQMSLTLVDSVAKKSRFLAQVVAECGLDGVTVLAERAETLGQDGAHREQYDWAVARSVAEFRVLLEYLLPLCRVGGKALAQKGETAVEELKLARTALYTLGGSIPQQRWLQLPGHDKQHLLLVVEKIKATPPKYPRRAGMPAKRPL